MNKSELINKWQEEMEETFQWIQNTKDDSKRLVFISRHTAISDILEDIKNLNEETVKQDKSCDTCEHLKSNNFDDCKNCSNYSLWVKQD